MTRLLLQRTLAVAVLLFGVVHPLSAHPALRKAVPAVGAELDSPPTEIRLTFSLPVNSSLATVRLESPSNTIDLGDPSSHPDSAQVLIVRVVGGMEDGEYTVRWKVVGDDGHPVDGEYGFKLRSGAGEGVPVSGAGPQETPTDLQEGPGQGEDPEAPAQGVAGSDGATTDPGRIPGPPGSPSTAPGFGVGSPIYVLVRWANFGGILGVLGAIAFALLIVPSAGRRIGEGPDPALRRLSSQVGVMCSAIVLLAGFGRFLVQRAAVFGPSSILALGDGTLPLLSTQWGAGLGLQFVGGLAALIGFLWAAKGKPVGWAVAALAGLVVAVVPALSGHASAVPESPVLPVFADVLHVVGAGGWIGSLFVLLLALSRTHEPGKPTASDLANAFSPTALGFAGILAVSGFYGSWIHLSGIEDLWTTDWGRVLSLKLILVLPVIGAGAYNAFRVRPALSRGENPANLRRSVGLELMVASAVLLVTAVLVAKPSPVEGLNQNQSAEGQVLATVQAFHEALEAGDRARAVSLLAEDAVILEGGNLETKEEYLAHHLEADMAFAAAVERTPERGAVRIVGEVAWVASTNQAEGSIRGRDIESTGAELVVLSQDGEGWRIEAIHWSASR